jgi:hypothetical protein
MLLVRARGGAMASAGVVGPPIARQPLGGRRVPPKGVQGARCADAGDVVPKASSSLRRAACGDGQQRFCRPAPWDGFGTSRRPEHARRGPRQRRGCTRRASRRCSRPAPWHSGPSVGPPVGQSQIPPLFRCRAAAVELEPGPLPRTDPSGAPGRGQQGGSRRPVGGRSPGGPGAGPSL